MNHTCLGYDVMLKKQKENELILLGMVINGKEQKKGHIMQHINRDMFVEPLHQEIFDLITDQYKKHGADRLNPDCLINDYQGKQFKNAVFEALLQMEYEYITDVNCDYYIKRIQETWLARRAESCRSLEDFKKLEEEQKQYELINRKTLSKLNDLDDIAALGDEYDLRANATPVKTYYNNIDEKLGSLQGGDLLILAGSTGMGKTCTMLNLVTSMAKNGKKVLMFSLEMTKAQLLNRIVSAETGINAKKFRNNSFTPEEEAKYFGYLYSEEFNRIEIQTCTEYNIPVERIRNIVLASNCDIVCIDYLGLIKGDGRQTSYEKFSEISRQLKLLAMESNKPFIVLHQLNRANKDRENKRPQISDLRDSGKIEQDADFICFVYRPAYYTPSADPTFMEFIIAKNRHGEGGIANLKIDMSKQKIYDKQQWEF